jgi:DNA helicase II / ATP-dependent DNA helicase PcrA
MTTDELISLLYPPGSAKNLTAEQRNIVRHPSGPGWVLAGPGSGKTEVLALTVLRLLYVDNDPIQQHRVPPEAIFVTTFTDKAARNLEDRILNYRAALMAADPNLSAIDVSKLRIGTLHGLGNDLLQEFRAPNYQNVRLMDDFEQALFVREHMSLIKTRNAPAEIAFWQGFPWIFTQRQWQGAWANPPSRWNSTHALVKLFNRIVEDRVSIAALHTAGGQLRRLAELYEEYLQHLSVNYRCDFAQLQGRFLAFLGTPLGQSFLDGDGTSNNPGIRWVLVDEYQDTNPMQEEIYFRLAAAFPHNLLVVGDDDQAMYRFRGGSVECMVTFDAACQAFLGVPANTITPYTLVENFRSHLDIVGFFNAFITAFPVMAAPGARAPKPAIVPRKVIPHSYPAIGRLAATTLPKVARLFAETVAELIQTGKVNDASECCLLLKSTKETPLNAARYVDALLAEHLTVYNPRNKAFAEQEEVQGLLGAILAIVDPHQRFAQDPQNVYSVPAEAAVFRSEYDRLAAAHPDLATYVAQCQAAVTAHPAQPFDCNLQELAYYLMSREPFSTWQGDPVRRVRIGRITKLLESYSSTPVQDSTTGLPRPNVTRGFMRGSGSHPGEVNQHWLRSFFHLLLTYVIDAGIDDEEDEEVICPTGMVPVMTMHQSKGLEFPFVFVGHMGETPHIGASHRLESLFAGHPANPARAFARPPEAQRAEMDLIRQYYVAYSRAEYALIFVGTNAHFSKHSVPCGPTVGWLRQRTNLL